MKYSKLSKGITVEIDYRKLATLSATLGLPEEDLTYLQETEKTKIAEGQIEKITFSLLQFKEKHGRLLRDDEMNDEFLRHKRVKGLMMASFGQLVLFTPNWWQRFYNRDWLAKPCGTLNYGKDGMSDKTYPCRIGTGIAFQTSRAFASGENLVLVRETAVENIMDRIGIAYTYDGTNGRRDYASEKVPSRIMV